MLAVRNGLPGTDRGQACTWGTVSIDDDDTVRSSRETVWVKRRLNPGAL